MKNISFDSVVSQVFSIPVSSFLYPDMGAPASTSVKDIRRGEFSADQNGDHQVAPGPTAQEIEDLQQRARMEGGAEAEKRLRKEYEARSEGEAVKILQALEHFQAERKGYFSRVESEVVHLALAISAKVLHREAQVDPLLVAALVRVAIEKLHDGSSVSVRVSPAKAEKWREYLASPLNGSVITIVEDIHLDPEDCILETGLGSANFSIDAQLKEVELGFFDLLAQRPADK